MGAVGNEIMTILEKHHADAVWHITTVAHGGAPFVSRQSCIDDLSDAGHVAVGIIASDSTLEAFARAVSIAGAWHVIDVGVLPDFRGTGRGHRVISMLLDALAERGDDGGMTLEVHERNHAAIAVYSRAGFMERGRRSAYYPDGAGALIMWRAPSAMIARGDAESWEPVL